MNAKIEAKPSGMDRAAKQPSPRQQAILDAYLENPNAAAVGRANKMSERNVRRIVQSFGKQLAERRRERAEEQLARVSARAARIQDWADATLAEGLRRLAELAASPNEGVALRAIKMMLDMALQGSAPVWAQSELDIALQESARDVVRRLQAIDIPADDDASRGSIHG